MRVLTKCLWVGVLVCRSAVIEAFPIYPRVLCPLRHSDRGGCHMGGDSISSSNSAIRSQSDFRERLREEKLESSGLKRRSENERFEILQAARQNSRSVAKILWRNRPLGRLHELALFSIYAGAGIGLSRSVSANYAQVLLLSTWMSFSLAISFMEAWVKFRAPLLRKHVAVDVGRHVFAALHAVQLGIVAALWCGRRWSIGPVNPYLLASASSLQLVLSFWMGPFLYARAQDKMIHESGNSHSLTSNETEALKKAAKVIKNLNLPGKKWHALYVVVETIMVFVLGLSLKTIVMAST